MHLTYSQIHVPRRRDYLIMDYTMNKGATKEDLSSMSRVRGLLCEIFVSGIVTADGKYLKEFATSRTYSREHASTYNFPKEAPTQEGWMDNMEAVLEATHRWELRTINTIGLVDQSHAQSMGVVLRQGRF